MLAEHAEIEVLTQSLSITTFRFVPADLDLRNEPVQEYLNKLNLELLTRLQNSGAFYLSNAVIDAKFALRACIVNFRTSLADIAALPPFILELGQELDRELRPRELPGQLI